MNLNNFDTVIFDLDFTIWNGCQDKYWGKNLIPPIEIHGRKISGADNKYIEFHDGIKEVISSLNKNNKKIGFITLGGLLTVSYEDEPVIKCLKMYDIYRYFNHQKTVLYKTDKKSKHIVQSNRTIFIDDNEEVLEDIRNNCSSVTVLNRNDFKNWRELI